MDNPREVNDALFGHFKIFFDETSGPSPFKLQDNLITRLSIESSRELVEPFTLKEIEGALASMDSTKAPGPDGINAGDLKALWQEIKDDFLKFFSNFFDKGIIPWGLGSSFLALIPKIPSPKKPSDFRPINLMNVSLKLLTKVLALRMRKVIAMVVSDSQSAFIQGRQMTDCIIITAEVFEALRSKKKSNGVIMKLDFAKAFDTIKWDFVLQVLHQMNFNF